MKDMKGFPIMRYRPHKAINRFSLNILHFSGVGVHEVSQMISGEFSDSHRHHSAKCTTDDYLKLDVRHFLREGMLRPFYCGTLIWKHNSETVTSVDMRTETDRVIMSCRYRRGSREWGKQYVVYIERTSCHLGGARPWFICPDCRRRVAILYGAPILKCRQCHRLAYASTREGHVDRAIRRANRLRAKLGWKPGILNGGGPKPKWMRWPTFERLVEVHNSLVHQALR